MVKTAAATVAPLHSRLATAPTSMASTPSAIISVPMTRRTDSDAPSGAISGAAAAISSAVGATDGPGGTGASSESAGVVVAMRVLSPEFYNG